MKTTTLSRVRGDNYPITVTFGAGVDITGFVVTFSVARQENPVAPVTYLVQTTANLDIPNRKAVFSFTPEQMDLVGDYYYDVQVNADGVYYTVAKGKISFLQDITK